MAAKKKQEPQYTLNIFTHFDEKTHRDVTVFLVQTARIFINFRYEILLDASVNGDEISLKILGLHVPSVLLPESGPAVGVRQYDVLYGTYRMKVIKQDGTVNEFKVEFLPRETKITSLSPHPFILVSSSPVPFS